MWSIWIDANSEYGGAERVSNANEVNTVSKYRQIFALLGDPEQIVSDNRTQFTSREFSEFCNQHKIRHIRSAPYYPATNEKIKRFFQVFKPAIRANSNCTSYSTSISTSKFVRECEIHRFLQRYRTIPHSTTGRTPSKPHVGKTIRRTLHLIRPQEQHQVLNSQLCSVRNHDRTVHNRFLTRVKKYLFRPYLGFRKWAKGQILCQAKPLSYDVQFGDQVNSRHDS